jgi:hypothetical protein
VSLWPAAGQAEGRSIAGRVFFDSRAQPTLRKNVAGVLGGYSQERTMCEYSLHAVATRPAEVGESLISSTFPHTTTRGFASENDPTMAVCLRPGTELAFENEVMRDGLVFHRRIGDRLARFRQINTDDPNRHHDALEFANGVMVMVTDLMPGQRVIVLQLPADPAEMPAREERTVPDEVIVGLHL